MTAPLDIAATDQQEDTERSEWLHALSNINEGEHAELEFARAWADAVEVDYDEGPCAIGFKKGCTTYWYLIDDIGWDADDPRSELLTIAVRQRDAARAESDRLRALLKEACGIAVKHITNDNSALTDESLDRLAAIAKEGGVE